MDSANNAQQKPTEHQRASGDGMKTSLRSKESGGSTEQANPEAVPCSLQEKNQSGNHDKKASSNKGATATERTALEPFKWQHPEGKDDMFQKKIMKYISLRPEDLRRLELEMKKANANVIIAADHVAVTPPDNFVSQTAGNWRQECEKILGEFFTQFTVRTCAVDMFSPGNEQDDPAVDVHSHLLVEGVVTMSVTGRLSDVEQKIHQLEGEENQEKNNTTLRMPLQLLHRLEVDFIKKTENDNNVEISKVAGGVVIKGRQADVQNTSEDILSEVAKKKREYVSTKDWLKPMVMKSLREKQTKFPEMKVAFDRNVDRIVLTGHPYEVGIYATMIREVVADVESKFTCEVIPVEKQLHGCIIGAQGRNVKRLRERFKVAVTVPSTKSDSCEVKVQGIKEGVRAAVEDIQKMISYRDRKSKTSIRSAPHEKEDVRSSVALLPSQNSQRRLRNEMQTISVPLTDLQAMVLKASQKEWSYVKNNVDSRVTLTFKKQIPSLVIKGDGALLKEGHVRVVKQLQTYNNFCVLDLKIDEYDMGRVIGRQGRNIIWMQSEYRVEIITDRPGRVNARKNVTIIGERMMVERVKRNLVDWYRAETVGCQQYQVRGNRIPRHDSMASLASINEPGSVLSLNGDEDDRRSETSSVSDCAANQQAVLYQWQAPSVDLLDFIKRSEQFMKQFDRLFGSNESSLIEETERSVTVVGQANDPRSWQSTVDAKLQSFFGNFDSHVVQFHPNTTIDKTDIDDSELRVKWQDNTCLVCGVKERVSEKVAEFEKIKSRKQSVAVELACDKYLLSFLRKNLNNEDERFTDSGHVTLHSEHIGFQSEILEVDSVEDWKTDCEKALDEILQKLNCTKVNVPLIYHGDMRKQIRQSDEVSVEWCQEDSCLVVYGCEDFAHNEVQRLRAVLYDLEHKKKNVTMRYQCKDPEIAAFVTENIEQMENLVEHMRPLGSPALDKDTRDSFTILGDIFETESTAKWEEKCRVKIEHFFLRYKFSKIDVGHSMRGFCMTLAKSGSNVAVRWIDEENSLLIIGINSLVDAMEKSLRETIKEESAVSLAHESLSVDDSKEITLVVQAANSAFKWLELSKQRRILRDVKYRNSDAGIEITGKEGKVQKVKTLIDSISVKEWSIEKYGVYKLLKEATTRCLIEEVEINCNCGVQIDRLQDTEFGDEIFIQLPKKSIGSITYEIKDGDITKEDVDVIVNTTNKSFSFDGPLSRAVFREAGEDLRNSMITVDADIRYSDAGNLKCRKIIHVAIPKTNESMEDLLVKILRHADGMKMKSIALPALGGGNGGWNNEDVAVAMRKSFEKFEAESSDLKKIVVVLYGRSVVALYENILKQELAPVEEKPGIIALIRRFFSFISPEPVPEPPPKAAPASTAPSEAAGAATGQHAKVTVSADSKDNLNKAVEELQTMVKRFITNVVIDSEAVLRISESDLSEIHKMAKEHDVRVIVNKKNDVHSVTIQGNKDDASKVEKKVQEIVSGISTDLPKNWISTDEKMIPVKLDRHSAEYRDIENLFYAANKRTGCYFSVEQIDRIQNLSLYRQYQSKKVEISKRKTPPAHVEMRLFHGTDKETVEAICKEGFNRSFAGRNATMYGKGTYFSTESSYSTSYARKDIRGKQRMFVADVLTGDYCKGGGWMVDAPDNSSTGERFDSVVDHCGTPTIYVVFRDWSAYPTYVITYTSRVNL